MAENSLIEWTEHTFNPWMGCTMVAPECTHCYAKTLMDDRYGNVKWGPKGTRVVTAASTWAKVLKWDRDAAKAGVPARVFCCSLADVFEDDRGCTGGEDRGMHTLNDVRARLWALIESTPNLIWLLLTKRPENILGMVPASWLEAGRWPSNVWTGTSAGCQATADDAVPKLLEVPGRHFLSCEPMLGPVDLTRIGCDDTGKVNALAGLVFCDGRNEPAETERVHWVICGGESGPGARPMHPDWARGLRDQCAEAGVPFFFKQWGEFYPHTIDPEGWADHLDCIDPLGRPCAVSRGKDRWARGVCWWSLRPWEQLGLWHENGIPEGAVEVRRVGKKAAGRVLDGRTWDELPEEFTAPISVKEEVCSA